MYIFCEILASNNQIGRFYSKCNNFLLLFSLPRAYFSLPSLLNLWGICLQIFKNSVEQLQINLTLTFWRLSVLKDFNKIAKLSKLFKKQNCSYLHPPSPPWWSTRAHLHLLGLSPWEEANKMSEILNVWEYISEVPLREGTPVKVLLLVPGSWKGGRSWRHRAGAGRACFPDTSLNTMIPWDFFLVEGKVSVPKWNSPVKQKRNILFIHAYITYTVRNVLYN